MGKEEMTEYIRRTTIFPKYFGDILKSKIASNDFSESWLEYIYNKTIFLENVVKDERSEK